jgi:hypothetical protein
MIIECFVDVEDYTDGESIDKYQTEFAFDLSRVECCSIGYNFDNQLDRNRTRITISGINYTIDIPFKDFKKLWLSQ